MEWRHGTSPVHHLVSRPAMQTVAERFPTRLTGPEDAAVMTAVSLGRAVAVYLPRDEFGYPAAAVSAERSVASIRATPSSDRPRTIWRASLLVPIAALTPLGSERQ